MKNVLNDKMEKMRAEVVELELRARYWKAQYEVRHFTLEAEKIQPAYNEYLEAQRVKNEELQKAYEEKMKELENISKENPETLKVV